jgi:predicted RNase H-like HicB family nuclease
MKKKNNSDYGKMLMNYLGKWVALSSDEASVVASGDTLAETVEKAKNTKEKYPIYVMVSENIGNFSFC